MAQATVVNNSVAMISSIESSSTSQYALIGTITDAASKNNVTLTRVTLQSDGTPILVAGEAQDEAAISTFKSAIEQTPGFTSVDLPLQGIQSSGSQYTFSMTFSGK